MQGLMQEQPLLISTLLRHAERHHGDAEIVSRRVEGDVHRYTYRDLAARSRQLANALDRQDLQAGARVASIAWNGYRHMELYFGVSGSGRIMHTLNPRLPLQQLTWIINHAEDEIVCFDLSFLPLVQAGFGECPTVRQWVALCDADALPTDAGIPGLISYEAWIAGESSEYQWPILDENTASGLCYTSGTTGDPKGALYSHRSTILHAYACALPDSLALSALDSVLPVVPMFHVNAWGLPYEAALVGCKLVYPGPAMDGASLYELIESEQVTFAAGVPTVWQALIEHVQEQGLRFSSLNRTMIGGSACPPALASALENDYGVQVMHGWGMTEISPVGTLAHLKRKHLTLPPEQQRAVRLMQGRVPFGIDMKIVDDDGREIDWDGTTYGDLWVSGPWAASAYFRQADASPVQLDAQGRHWFPTGDVATIDADGNMQIVDRTKDVIKSGGEWISSIALENIAMSHPAVAMAACIGVADERWGERPVLVVVRKPGQSPSAEEILQLYEGEVVRWQVPDQVCFVDEIPLGGTGKMQKRKLRDQLGLAPAMT